MAPKNVTTLLLDPGSVPEPDLTYVVIGARFGDLWIFVRHRDRTTWEMPAGHIELHESPDRAAVRELYEEAGVTRSSLVHLCDYAVTVGARTEFGRLYQAEVLEMEETLEHETDQVLLSGTLPSPLTYPEVQRELFRRLPD